MGVVYAHRGRVKVSKLRLCPVKDTISEADVAVVASAAGGANVVLRRCHKYKCLKEA